MPVEEKEGIGTYLQKERESGYKISTQADEIKKEDINFLESLSRKLKKKKPSIRIPGMGRKRKRKDQG